MIRNEYTNDESKKSVVSVILSLFEAFKIVYNNKFKIILICFISGILGFFLVYFQDITYTAKVTFLVEDTKSGSGLSGLASLAGQFGVDVSSAGPGGVIANDNIINYLKSESLSREVLLSPIEKDKSFATYYIEIQGLREKWSKNKKIGLVDFPTNKKNVTYTRIQDSLINVIIVDYILKKQLLINKVDKKSGFIQILFTTKSEVFSKKFCDMLLDIAVKRYVNHKTARQQKTVDNLQFRLDSIVSVLNKKTNASAKLQTVSSTIDMNPLYKTSMSVITEATMREKTMLSTVYAEVIKNLELAKFTLNQETPVIQIIDEQRYPLKVNKNSKLIFSILFFSVALFLSIFYTVAWYFLKPYYITLKNDLKQKNN